MRRCPSPAGTHDTSTAFSAMIRFCKGFKSWLAPNTGIVELCAIFVDALLNMMVTVKSGVSGSRAVGHLSIYVWRLPNKATPAEPFPFDLIRLVALVNTSIRRPHNNYFEHSLALIRKTSHYLNLLESTYFYLTTCSYWKLCKISNNKLN